MTPPLVKYGTEVEYRTHFERVYCLGSIFTFDAICVKFRRHHFNHCMFESTARDRIKDKFSMDRALRIDWIKATLEHPDAELYQGWDRDKKRHVADRRAAIIYENFVVVIRFVDDKKAEFVTAYHAGESIDKIKRGPKWK